MAKISTHRGRLLAEIRSLSEDRLGALADFAAYLREREEWEATAEILGDAEAASQIARSRKAWAEGRKEEFISLKASLGSVTLPDT